MSKLIRKCTVLLLSVLLLAGMLVGCTGNPQQSGGQPGSNPAQPDSGQKVTITAMQQNDPSHGYFTALGQEFTKLHPNITVNYIGVPYEEFDSKLLTMLASGTQPDITTHVQNMGFMDYYAKGLLTDLTPYIQKYKFDNKTCGIPDSIMSIYNFDGKQWGIPLNVFTSVLMYNKDLFDKAGVPYPPSDYSDTSWTFDKMIEVAKRLTSGEGQNKIYGLNWAWDGGMAMQDPDYFGASIFPPEALKTGRPTGNNLKDAKVINAYQTIADLTFKHGVSPTPAYVTALAGSDASDPFYSGRIAMEVEGAWGLSGVNELPFKVGVAAIPAFPNSNSRAVIYTDPYFILKGSKHPDAAFQYLAFLAESENQIKMVQQSGTPPSSTAALETYYKNFSTIDPKDMKNAIEGSYKYGVEDIEHLIVGAGEIHILLANEFSPVLDGTETAEKVCIPLADKLDETIKSIK
jgi:multiple sugar transport system substrate-binding protein